MTSVQLIAQRVADRFGVTVHDLKSDRQDQTTTRARHVAIYLATLLTPYSNAAIGRLFRRDYTTVAYSVRRARKLAASDGRIALMIQELRRCFEEESGAIENAAAIAGEALASRVAREIVRVSRLNPQGLLDALSKLALAAVVTGGLALPAGAAETVDVVCFLGREDLVRAYRRAGQLRIFEGAARSGLVMDVLRNRDGAFTVIWTNPEDVACVVGSGAHSNLFPPSSPGPLPHPVPEAGPRRAP